MKRTYKIALSLVLSLGIVAPAFAQDSFPDVQDTHWAADAIKRLKLEKFIQGMPNGNFEGSRAITRYEMASLVYAVYAKLVCFDEEVAVKIKDLEAKINKKSGEISTPPAPVDNSSLKAALASLKSDVGTMKAWGADISMLKKMTASYSKELTSLGADVTGMKKQLNDLSMRVSALEKKTDNVVISGDANLLAFASTKDSSSAVGYNQDGRFTTGTATGAGLDSLGVLHELGLKLNSGASAQRAWGAELVIGNVATTGIGNQSDFAGQIGTAYGKSPASEVYLNTAWAALPEVLNSTVGRQNLNLGSYILARPDFTSFYNQERWDNGAYLMDGLKTGTYGFGGITVNAFVGRFGATTSAGTALQPVMNGVNPARLMGGQIGFNLGDFAKLTGTYLNLDGNNGPINRNEIYGVDGDFSIAGLAFKGGYGKSVQKFNQGTIVDTDNVRYNASTTLFKGINIGYDHVEQNYVAPGDWGRTGVFRNLVDVNRLTADAGFDINSKWHLNGGYASNKSINGVGETKGWNVGLKTALTPKWGMMLTHENTQFDGGFQGSTPGGFARFSTIWLDYDAGSNSLLKLFYQMGDTSGILANPGGGGLANQKGGFFGMQYGIKF